VPDVEAFYHQFNQWLTTIIDEGIARGVFRRVNSNAVAATIIAALDGIMFQAALGLIRLDAPEIRATIRQTMLEGIKTQQRRIT
jgi:hypothetical protein